MFVLFGEEEEGDASNASGLMKHSARTFGSRVNVVNQIKPGAKGAYQFVVAVGQGCVYESAHFVDQCVGFFGSGDRGC